MSMRQRMLLAFALLAAIVLTVSLLAIHGLTQANNRFTSYLSGVGQREVLATQIREAAERRAIAARNLVLVTEPVDARLEQAAVTTAHQDTQNALANLRKAVDGAGDVTDGDRRLLADIEAVESKYAPVATEIVRMALAGQHDAAVHKMNIECRPLLAALLVATEAFVDNGRMESKRYATDAENSFAHERIEMTVACVFAVLAAIVLGVMLSNSITGPLRVAVSFAKNVAAGDLTHQLTVTSRDETGQLLQALRDMQDKLAGIVQQVRTGAESVGSASQQIAQGNSDLSDRTQEQAAALEETAASMEEMTATVKRNADNARAANELAADARTHAEQGGAVVSKAVSAMVEINEASKRIADIIGVIDEIAFQTNLLALNAAVEAARAGEQGRGFAVVASEVRNLAQRSATAAKEIKELIGDSVEKVRIGSTYVDESGRSLKEIVTSVRQVTDIVAEISAASNEQASGIDQVNNAITQMDTATQHNASLVSEASSASRALETEADALVRHVAYFRVAHDVAAVPPAAVRHATITNMMSKTTAKKARITALATESAQHWLADGTHS